VNDIMQQPFSLTRGWTNQRVARGFQLTFANGWTASVQWGQDNYCSNHYGEDGRDSGTAEIAAFSGDVWLRVSGCCYRPLPRYQHNGGRSSDVRGWVPADEIPAFLAAVARQKPVS